MHERSSTASGQALRDALSSQGENAVNLHYHFVLVAVWHPGGWSARAGRDLPTGWGCADGDNCASGDVLEFYPDTVVAASQPCAAMAVYPRVKMGGMEGNQVGYTLNGDGTVTFASGIHVLGGFSADITQHGAPSANSEPLQQEFYHGADTAILLWNTGEVWVWTRSDGKVHRDRAAEIVQMYRTDAANAEAKASVPTPVPADAAAEASAAAIRALAAALAEVGK